MVEGSERPGALRCKASAAKGKRENEKKKGVVVRDRGPGVNAGGCPGWLEWGRGSYPQVS